MNVMRFVGRTSREAMKKLRDTLGPDALVLANRPCAEGVELLAAAPGALGGLPARAPEAAAHDGHAGVSARTARDDRAPTPSRAAGPEEPVSDGAGRARPVAGDAAREVPPSMSTVSFQDYVRQRLRERARAQAGSESVAASAGDTARLAASARAAVEAGAVRPVPQPAVRHPGAAASVSDPDTGYPVEPAVSAGHGPMTGPGLAMPAAAAPGFLDVAAAPASTGFLDPVPGAARAGRGAAALRSPSASLRSASPPSPGLSPPAPMPHRAAPQADVTALGADALMSELQSLRGVMSRQFATISWFEGVRRSPVQGALLRTMVSAGFSLKLARSVVSRLPSDFGERDAQPWMEAVLARNLRCAASGDVFRAGNVCALIGPTGVGKTTTTAKLAARHVLAHGAASVALITVDTYRLGAHDQLRAFGRILGVPVHVAHDAPALHDLLRLRNDRQLVLIDTVGLGHRDERIRSLLMSLPRTDIRHVVVASAAAQGETIDASLRAFEAKQAAGVVLTKVDEAARLGGAIDCLVRQRTTLLGVCDGQRVPEDWHEADPQRLVRQALIGPEDGAFALHDEELPLVFGVAVAREGEGVRA